MKKKSIISILLVFLILGVSHNIWLTIKPKAPVAVETQRGGGGSSLTVLDGNSTEPLKQPRPSIKFDAMMFIIIAILGYLLSYRLTSYLADFKVEKHYSRIDIVFLAVCAVIMYLPMSHISDAKKSEAENRDLANWRSLINKQGQINYKFGRCYENWFSDRFNYREQLFTLYVKTFVLPNRYPKFANRIWNKKENNFLYMMYEREIVNFDIDKVSSKLKELKKYLDKRNIKLVVYVVPDREFLLDKKKRYPLLNLKPVKIEKLVSELSDIDIFFNLKLFEDEQAEHNLIYHNDHHLNEYGSYIVYKDLCSKLGLKPVSLDDYEIVKSNKIRDALFMSQRFFNGWLQNGFPILRGKDELLDTQYTYYDYKRQNEIQIKEVSGRKFSYKIYNPAAPLNERVYVVHNSFGERVLQFLQTNYKYIMNVRYNVFGTDFSNLPFVSDIDSYKPDTVIIIINTYLLRNVAPLKLKN